MAVRIRLTRYGKRNRPFFRIGVFDSRTRRDGAYLENLGLYDPLTQDVAKKLKIKVDRLHHWVSRGALPTPKMEKLLLHCGVPLKAVAAPAASASAPKPEASKAGAPKPAAKGGKAGGKAAPKGK